MLQTSIDVVFEDGSSTERLSSGAKLRFLIPTIEVVPPTGGREEAMLPVPMPLL